MKLQKYISAFVIAACGLLASCETDNMGTTYQVYTQNVSFVDASTDVKTTESSTEVVVKVFRHGTNGEYTAHYTQTPSQEGIFTDANNGTVTFSDGQSTAFITLKAQNMEKGVTYTDELTFSEAEVAVADTILDNAILSSTVTILCEYEWDYLGKGLVISGFFEEEWENEVYKAKGTNIYKFADCYAAGYDIQFELNADNTALAAPIPTQATGYKYGSYGMTYVQNDGTYPLEVENGVLYIPMKWTVSAGSFGWLYEGFKLP